MGRLKILNSLVSALLILTTAPSAATGRPAGQDPAVAERTKSEVGRLQAEYDGLDEAYREEFLKEVSKQADSSPRGEFETTREYQARLARGGRARAQLRAQYDQRRRARKRQLLQQLNALLDLEFSKPVEIKLGRYDADEESFPLTARTAEGEEYEDIVRVPRGEAKALKDNFSEASKAGVFAINQSAEEYFLWADISFRGKTYTSRPPELVLSRQQLPQYYGVYTEPSVRYLRKVFNAYLANPDGDSEEFRLLRQYDEAYYQSKFIVYSVDPFLAGGKLIQIVFQEKPDAVFSAWVYGRGDWYELRLLEAKVTDAKTMRAIRVRYGKFLQDKVHAL